MICVTIGRGRHSSLTEEWEAAAKAGTDPSVGAPAPAAQYIALVQSGYFRVVELNDVRTSPLEEAIANVLRHDPAYQVAADGRYGLGTFTIWARRP